MGVKNWKFPDPLVSDVENSQNRWPQTWECPDPWASNLVFLDPLALNYEMFRIPWLQIFKISGSLAPNFEISRTPWLEILKCFSSLGLENLNCSWSIGFNCKAFPIHGPQIFVFPGSLGLKFWNVPDALASFLKIICRSVCFICSYFCGSAGLKFWVFPDLWASSRSGRESVLPPLPPFIFLVFSCRVIECLNSFHFFGADLCVRQVANG